MHRTWKYQLHVLSMQESDLKGSGKIGRCQGGSLISSLPDSSSPHLWQRITFAAHLILKESIGVGRFSRICTWSLLSFLPTKKARRELPNNQGSLVWRLDDFIKTPLWESNTIPGFSFHLKLLAAFYQPWTFNIKLVSKASPLQTPFFPFVVGISQISKNGAGRFWAEPRTLLYG